MADPLRESLRHRGLIDAHWLQTVELPSARAFSRGYDRMTVDVLLEDCAQTIDELTGELRLVHDDVETLRRQARTRAARRRPGRGSVRRQGQPAAASRRRARSAHHWLPQRTARSIAAR